MGNFRLGRSHQGLDDNIGMHMLLNKNFSWLQGQTHSFGLFAGISWKVFFKAQSQT